MSVVHEDHHLKKSDRWYLQETDGIHRTFPNMKYRFYQKWLYKQTIYQETVDLTSKVMEVELNRLSKVCAISLPQSFGTVLFIFFII
jgi:hypothetical protein